MSELGLDTNVLVYAVDEESPFHKPARELLDRIEKGRIKAVTTWQNLAEFYAIVTDNKRLTKCLQPAQAVREVKNLAGSGEMKLVLPNSRTGVLWVGLLGKTKARAQRVHDLFLAATLLSNRVKILVTENTEDFTAVAGLKTVTLEEI